MGPEQRAVRHARDVLRRVRPQIRAAAQDIARLDQQIEATLNAEHFGTYSLRPERDLSGAHRFLAAARRSHPDQVLEITIHARTPHNPA